MAASATYIIDGGRSGADRLAVLDRVMGPMSEEFLERAGLSAGYRCLDVGCGSGQLTRRIARMAGPGEVVGVDADPAVVEIASTPPAPGLRFLVGDATALGAELSGFDLVHARFLLSHLPDPRAAVIAMAAACRPGGVVALADVDVTAMFSRPRSRALERSIELYSEAARLRGADPRLGLRLPDLLEAAGLRWVRATAVHPSFREGEGKLLSAITFDATRAAVLKSGLAGEAELDEIGAELWRAAEDPRTLISAPRIHQVFAIKPA